MRRLASPSAALLLVLFCGCGRDETPPPADVPAAAPAAQTAPVEPAPELPPVVIQAETADGQKVESWYTGEQQAPAGLPDDLPLYERAIPISSMATQDRGTIVNLRSEDPAEPIFGWYQAELPKHGWLVEKQSGAGGQRLITARKGSRKATVLVTTGPNGTQLLLTVLEDP